VLACIPAACLGLVHAYSAGGGGGAPDWRTVLLRDVPRAYASFVLALSVSVAGYRLGPWHPLARFPGPRAYALTRLWGVWLDWDGAAQRRRKELHERYGPVVRTGEL
jgi:hypothetical protein